MLKYIRNGAASQFTTNEKIVFYDSMFYLMF